MSNTPHPVALTALVLYRSKVRYVGEYDNDDGHEESHYIDESPALEDIARLASDLHRAAKGMDELRRRRPDRPGRVVHAFNRRLRPYGLAVVMESGGLYLTDRESGAPVHTAERP